MSVGMYSCQNVTSKEEKKLLIWCSFTYKLEQKKKKKLYNSISSFYATNFLQGSRVIPGIFTDSLNPVCFFELSLLVILVGISNQTFLSSATLAWLHIQGGTHIPSCLSFKSLPPLNRQPRVMPSTSSLRVAVLFSFLDIFKYWGILQNILFKVIWSLK